MRQEDDSNIEKNRLLRMEFISMIDFDKFSLIFECFSDICFFIKDTEGRLIAVNSQLLKRYNLSHESDIIGKTDFDFVPYSLAEKYRKDDNNIIETGKPMLNILELVLNPMGIPSWCITNKFPVISKNNKIIGISGNIHNIYNGTFNFDNKNFFYNILQYIDTNFNRKISIGELSRHFNLSKRSIERYFKKHLSISPEQFLIKTRIFKSCDYLRKGEYISTVALECGFYDQSSFTRHFKKQMGMTPLQYAKKYSDYSI